MTPLRSILPAAALLAAAPVLAIDYQKDILPIMKEHCWNCHSTEKDAKGGLALDDLAMLATDQINEIGLIRPGEPEKSDFLARLRLKDSEDDFMPRKGKALRNSEIGKIEEWIREGAIIDSANPSETELARAEDVKLKQARAGADIYFDWTNAQGKAIEAKYAGLEDEAVKIVMRNGRNFTVPFSSLSQESVELAKKLGGR
ncbi:MAG TPA: hypothetical protein PLA50_12610 [Bacteroidia bacterium]|nr:hypothetical protein [Bacteroidia bacterium]